MARAGAGTAAVCCGVDGESMPPEWRLLRRVDASLRAAGLSSAALYCAPDPLSSSVLCCARSPENLHLNNLVLCCTVLCCALCPAVLRAPCSARHLVRDPERFVSRRVDGRTGWTDNVQSLITFFVAPLQNRVQGLGSCLGSS
eukprot:2683-Chlamydomonas_euryale.AAC.1